MFEDMYCIGTTRGSQLEDLRSILGKTLKRAISASRWSPAQIAEQLAVRLNRPFKEGQICAWMKSEHKWHLPADAVPHLCEILGDDTIQRLLLSEKLRQSLELGESTPRIVAQLRSVLLEATERKEVRGEKKAQGRSGR
jgi:hypothetical protein